MNWFHDPEAAQICREKEALRQYRIDASRWRKSEFPKPSNEASSGRYRRMVRVGRLRAALAAFAPHAMGVLVLAAVAWGVFGW